MNLFQRRPLQRRLVLLPVLACLACAPVTHAVVVEIAPTLNEVNKAMQAQDYPAVEKMCSEIVAEDSSSSQGWFLLGYSLHAQGKIDRAIMAHITATAFPDTAPLAYFNLGCAQALKGNPDQAFAALKMAAKLGINNPQQYTGDSDLVSLRKDARWSELLGSMRPNLTAESTKKSTKKSTASAKASDSKTHASGATPTGLHFWVGAWDCYSAKSGKLAGHNTLEFRVKNQVIHEIWDSEGDAYSGESWNFFDPIEKAWRQNWIGNGGDVTQFIADTKSDVEGVMFVGKAFNPKDGDSYTHHKMHVRPVGYEWVRQTGSASKDDGATWTVEYDLIYVPKGEAFDLEDLGI